MTDIDLKTLRPQKRKGESAEDFLARVEQEMEDRYQARLDAWAKTLSEGKVEYDLETGKVNLVIQLPEETLQKAREEKPLQERATVFGYVSQMLREDNIANAEARSKENGYPYPDTESS